MQSHKTSILGSIFGGLGSVMHSLVHDDREEIVEIEAPKSMKKPEAARPAASKSLTAARQHKSFPSKKQLAAMSEEKRAYWTRRMAGVGMPSWYRKPDGIQFLAGRKAAANPEPITRQVRRRLERKGRVA